jgi:pyridoxamine 5'-phosphate oxidase
MPGLSKRDFGPDPFESFAAWFGAAEKSSGLPHPNAMALATLGEDGYPQARIVLLKGWDREGLRFYTNGESEKGRALAAHPKAELCFHWDVLGRQVRVRGGVRPSGDADSDAYFASRPRESQLAAWASEQSRPVADRAAMDARYAEMERRFEGQAVPRPPHWGGWLLSPVRFEFWQQGAHRFHDRFAYLKSGQGWDFSRLNP